MATEPPTPCLNRWCRDGMVREEDGWAICDDCHGTSFALPLFPSPELFAAAKAARYEANEAARAAALAKWQACFAERDAKPRRPGLTAALTAALAVLVISASVAASTLVHNARAMQGQPVDVLAEQAAR